MTVELSGEDILARLREHPRENYTFIFSVMKGVTLANAALAVMTVTVVKPSAVGLLLWATSFAAFILTYSAVTVGLAMAAFQLGWIDAVVPFSIAILEFLLFSVIQDTDVMHHWYLIFAMYHTGAAIMIHSIIRRTEASQYEPSLKDAVSLYESRVRGDRLAASLTAIVFTACALIASLGVSWWPRFGWVSAALGLVVMIQAIRQTEKTRRDTRAAVLNSLAISDVS